MLIFREEKNSVYFSSDLRTWKKQAETCKNSFLKCLSVVTHLVFHSSIGIEDVKHLHPHGGKEKSTTVSASLLLNTCYRKAACLPRIPVRMLLAVLQDQGLMDVLNLLSNHLL